jgi:hypothetical protein
VAICTRERVKEFIEEFRGKVITPYQAEEWIKKRHKTSVKLETICKWIRELCPKIGRGGWLAVERPRERAEQIYMFDSTGALDFSKH